MLEEQICELQSSRNFGFLDLTKDLRRNDEQLDDMEAWVDSLRSISPVKSSSPCIKPLVQDCSTDTLDLVPAPLLGADVSLTSDLLSASLKNEQLSLQLASAEQRLSDQSNSFRKSMAMGMNKFRDDLASLQLKGTLSDPLTFPTIQSSVDVLEFQLLDSLNSNFAHRSAHQSTILSDLRNFRQRLFPSLRE